MTSRRTILTALVVCGVLPAGTAGCASRAAQGQNRASPSPAGSLLGERDEYGHPYREAGGEHPPEVGVEVAPDDDGGWDVRLRIRNFRFSPEGTREKAVAGRGVARLEVNGRHVALLRTPEYRLSGSLVQRGTHRITARLYADDGSVWTVDGKPVESTADVTVSEQRPDRDPSAESLTGVLEGRGCDTGRRDGGRGRGSPRSAVPA